MLSQEAFHTSFSRLSMALARRRKRYLALFLVHSLLAAVMLITAGVFAEGFLSWCAGLLHRTKHVTAYETASFIVFAGGGSVLLMITPLVRFRGGMKRDFSLDRFIWLTIGEWLGECRPDSAAMSHIYALRQSHLFPKNAGITERLGLRGTIHTRNYSLSEMSVATPEGCLFSGLVMVIRLTGKPHSLLLPPHQSAHELWLTQVAALAAQARTLPERKETWDSRLLTGIAAFAASRPRFGERPALASELAYDSGFTPVPLLGELPCAQSAYNDGFGFSVSGAHAVLALPAPVAFFTPASLFGPSLTEAHVLFLRSLINCIGTLRIPESSIN